MEEILLNWLLKLLRADCPRLVKLPEESFAKSTIYLLIKTFLTLSSICPLKSNSMLIIGLSIESKNQFGLDLNVVT